MIRNLHTEKNPCHRMDTKFTKAMIDAMTLAEFEKPTPNSIFDIASVLKTRVFQNVDGAL